MNYAYLGDRLEPSAAENFPVFVADLFARADRRLHHPLHPLPPRRRDPAEYEFPTPQALLDYATHRLLWSWYKRDRNNDLKRPLGGSGVFRNRRVSRGCSAVSCYNPSAGATPNTTPRTFYRCPSSTR